MPSYNLGNRPTKLCLSCRTYDGSTQGPARRHAYPCPPRKACQPKSICISRSSPVNWLQSLSASPGVILPTQEPGGRHTCPCLQRQACDLVSTPLSCTLGPVLPAQRHIQWASRSLPRDPLGSHTYPCTWKQAHHLQTLKWILVPASAL